MALQYVVLLLSRADYSSERHVNYNPNDQW